TRTLLSLLNLILHSAVQGRASALGVAAIGALLHLRGEHVHSNPTYVRSHVDWDSHVSWDLAHVHFDVLGDIGADVTAAVAAKSAGLCSRASWSRLARELGAPFS